MSKKAGVKKKASGRGGPRNRRLGGADKAAYRVISFVYYDDGQPQFDTAIDDGTITDFLLELNDRFELPSILFAVEVSKEQYEKLDAALDAVEEEEGVVPIGGGYTARVVDTEEEPLSLDEALREQEHPPGQGDREMSYRNDDPDVVDEGDRDLDRDERTLDDSEFDED